MNATMAIRVTVESRNAQAQIAAMQRQIKSLQMGGGVGQGFAGGMQQGFAAMQKFGKQLQWTGRQIEFRITLPLVLAGAAAMKFALANETAMTHVRKVYDGAGLSAKELNKELQLQQQIFESLSNIYGVAQADVINIGGAWAEAGARGTALAKVTRLTLDTMILGNQTSDDAVQSLISLRAQYGLTANGLKDALGVINEINNNTSATFDDLIVATTRGGAAARTAGVDYRHFAAMVAALVPATGSAESAGNALKTIISRLMSPTKDAQVILGKLNVDMNSFMKLPADERISAIAGAFEKLSGSQQSVVSSFLASRFQISRFDQLMRDVVDTNGQYQTALRKTADHQKVMADYSRQIGIYLSSQPQAFKILTTQMQNMLAKAIIPLLPAILGVAEKILDLVTAFTNLAPETQEFIIFSLAALALSGPIIAYFGTFSTLLGVFGSGLVFAANQFNRLLMFLLRVPAVEGASMAGFKALGRGITGVFKAAFGAAIEITKVAMAAIGRVMVVTWGLLQPIFVAIGEALATAVSIGFSVVTALFGAIGAAAAAAFEAAAAIVAAAGLPLLIAAIAAALVIVVFIFRKQFVDAVNAAGHALAQLPRIVGQALMAVFHTIVNIGKAIYQVLQNALNPFQRHSPSLVDLVIAGVDIISRKYASLGSIGAHFRQAVADMNAFKNASKSMIGTNDDLDVAKKRISVSKSMPSALPAFDQQASSIRVLQGDLDLVGNEYSKQAAKVAVFKNQLDDANKSLKDQQNILDDLNYDLDTISKALDTAKNNLSDWAQTPIVGMQAMDDAIFSNQMQVKALELQLMQLQDSTGGIDAVADKFSKLQGDIEALRGESTSLRQAGAGSDVTGAIDAQVTALLAQQDQLQATASEMDGLQAQMDALQRAGQELDLENSLAFDPLKRQIDQVANSMQEMPFDVIIAGTRLERSNVDTLTASYAAQKAKVDAQAEAVRQLTHARDLIQRSYDAENDTLTELGDAYDGILQQINDMKQGLTDLASAADAFAQAMKDAAGGGGAGALFDQAAGGFDTAGGAAPFGDPEDLQKLADDWAKEAKKAFGNVKLGDIFKKPFEQAWKKFQEWWDRSALPWLKNAMGNAGQWLLEHIPLLFGGPFGLLVQIIWDNLDSIWQNIQNWWDNILGFFGGIGQTLIDIVTWPFRMIQDILVGHSIIPDTINAIEEWFLGLPDKIIKAIASLPGKLINFFGGAINWLLDAGYRILIGLLNGIVNGWNRLWGWFQGIYNAIVGFFGGALSWLWNAGVNILNGLWQGMVAAWNGVVSWLTSIGGWIMRNAILNPLGILKDIGRNIIQGLWDGIQEVWSKMTSWIGNAASHLPGFIKGPLHVTSPSRVMMELGGFVMEGFQIGLKQGYEKVEQDLKQMATSFVGDATFMATGIANAENYANNVTSASAVNNQTRNINFHGDLSFPNITSGDDAIAFITNLEALVD